jgi:hypothetical protein
MIRYDYKYSLRRICCCCVSNIFQWMVLYHISYYDHLPRHRLSDFLHTQPFLIHPDLFFPGHCAVSNAVLHFPFLFLFFFCQLQPNVVIQAFFCSRWLQMLVVGSSVGLLYGASDGECDGLLNGEELDDSFGSLSGPLAISRLQHSGPLFF